MAETEDLIVDVHVHHRWTELDAPPWAQIEATLDAAGRCGIAKLGLLGTGGASGVDPSREAISICNTAGGMITRRFPDTTFSLCYINPAHDPVFIGDEVRRSVEEYDMRGIKLWIAVNARDKRLDPVMEAAIRHDIPVFFHSWYKTVSWVYNESSPADMRDLALRFPEATIAMLHLPGGRERGVLDVADLPNVYVDTSGSQPDRGFVEYAVAHLGADRVLYGSDAPGRDFIPQLAKVTGATIDAAAKTKIMGTNAVKLLKLNH